ncbi:hypothetical protein J6590_002231 [Homalodisca vitripennis]|nr:hypothetical protein J6590_002231 [Homalodisca vitripennis]
MPKPIDNPHERFHEIRESVTTRKCMRVAMITLYPIRRGRLLEGGVKVRGGCHVSRHLAHVFARFARFALSIAPCSPPRSPLASLFTRTTHCSRVIFNYRPFPSLPCLPLGTALPLYPPSPAAVEASRARAPCDASELEFKLTQALPEVS